VEALADALRPEVEPFGIDVVNVLPGPISTRFEAVLLKSIPDISRLIENPGEFPCVLWLNGFG
jgi:short-subunit dehydrogenase